MIRVAWLACALLFPAVALAQPLPAPPDIPARSHVLYDHDSGQVIASSNPAEHVEPASLTKLMTVYIAFDQLRGGQLKLTDEVLISEKAWRSVGSRSFVEVGKRIPVEVLLHGIIVQSGNDASIAMAEHMAGTEEVFADLMNRYAKRLGMRDSHFTNATGLPDPKLVVSARDIAILSSAIVRDFPEYYEWFGQKEYVYNNIRQPNRNKLLWDDPSVDGLKTGHTESAGYSLSASAKRDGRRLVAVVIGTKSESVRADACLALLNYGFRFYENTTVATAGAPVATIRAWKGTETDLALGTRGNLAVTVPRGRAGRVELLPELSGPVFAPVSAGQELGTVAVSLEGKVLRREPLVALADLPEGGLWRRLSDEIRLLVQDAP